jgi:hypothetical protein
VATLLSRPGLAEANDNGAGAQGGDSSNLDFAGSLSFNVNFAADAETMGSTIGNTAEVCGDDGICEYFPNPDSAADGGLIDFIGEEPSGIWTICAGDSVAQSTSAQGVITNGQGTLATVALDVSVGPLP